MQIPSRFDNVTIPVYLMYHEKYPPQANSPQPMLFNAYGAYGTLMNPEFEIPNFSIVDRGVIYSYIDARGSFGKGALWHVTSLQKKKTFEDVISVIEYFIANNFTTSSQVALEGRSAGGLTVCSVAFAAPTLLKMVFCEVPFVDVINTESDPTIPLTAQEWSEWGNPIAGEEVYWYQKSYAPYEVVNSTILGLANFPTVLLTTGKNDPRVMYWEPTKLIAKIRALTPPNNQNNFQVLLRVEDNGHSHGSGDLWFKQLSQYTAFMLSNILPQNRNTAIEPSSSFSPEDWVILFIVGFLSIAILGFLSSLIYFSWKRKKYGLGSIQEEGFMLITK